ncbi:MAG: hypothetical protein A2Y15_04200 [Clostridiales bacterium GWF2_36_10]|nr:MAG: hypothetical protein A2Y15_04200 [Clostridiales bacterium GWF2_36_10]HAN20521.1 hypothetical protein [Clostridiales bacterium]
MKLILRKNDSATSLLLFIFNNYYTKNLKDSLKLSSLLSILKIFDKNETAIRMSLSRAVKSGFLLNCKKDNEVIYKLTIQGNQAIQAWNEGVQSYWKRYIKRYQPWDGKWYYIYIEFSSDKKQKIEIIDKLQLLGFSLINTNNWICPYYLKNEINETIGKYNLKCIIEILGEMNIRKDMTEFLDEVYKFDILRKKYKDFINIYEPKLLQTKEIYKLDKFVDSGQALPLLHELGWEFFTIASDDPVLPNQLFPVWEADKASSIMKEFRNLLLEASLKYLNKFD